MALVFQEWIDKNVLPAFLFQKAKTREQREAEVIPKLSEALKHGIGVMDNAFVTLELTTERKYYNYYS